MPSPQDNPLGPFHTPVLRENGYPHMVLDDYLARLRENRRARRARLASLRTRRDAERYQTRVRDAIERAFSPRPPRTPLNARVTGIAENRHARIEKVIFESRPGILVTAALYIPRGCDANHPLPAVLGACGHSAAGKAEPRYQEFPQRLAAAGFVTLIYDPLNQGERDQYARLAPKYRKLLNCRACCHAHNMMGKQLELVGEFFGMWRAWDGIRALDYLLSRPEVDGSCVGMTGNSGGGTETTWLFPIEERITMAAPSCFVTSFASNLENELPADCEQYPPGVLGAGLEMADFLIAAAPRPSLLLGQDLDFFDRRGLREAHAEIARFYRLLGAPADAHGLFSGPEGHGFGEANQRAMVDFFHRHAGKRGRPRQLAAHEVVPLQESLLWAAPKGNVLNAGATPVYVRIGETARALERKRPKLRGDALARCARRLLGLTGREGTPAGAKHPPHYRALGPLGFESFRAARFAVETEYASAPDDPGARIRAVLLHPRKQHGFTLDAAPRIVLYLPHVSAEHELNHRALAGGLIARNGRRETLYAFDPRGMGASMHLKPGRRFFEPYDFDYMHHGHGLLFGESFLGRRVFDVLRVLDLLAAHGAKNVDLIGRGQGALLAAFAALLAPHLVRKATLRNAPVSFQEWASAPVVWWPAANFPRGVLRHFDLPDLYAALGKRVKIVGFWDAELRTVRQGTRSLPGWIRRRSAE